MLGLSRLMHGASKADPQFGAVRLLLHGEGANGGTTFTDNSAAARTLIPTGAVITSTAQQKFGASSIEFPSGTSLMVSGGIANANNFPKASTPGTIEMFLRANIAGFSAARGVLVGQWDSTSGGQGWTIDVDTAGQIFLGSDTSAVTIGSVGIPDNAWCHLAVVNDGTNITIYRDGVNKGSTACYSPSNGSDFILGNRSDGALPFRGFIDEFRYTQGVARYTAGFTPPTLPFPNF